MKHRHLRETESGVTLCGRHMGFRRVHRDWPLCKTCERLCAGRGVWSQWDEDGWMVPVADRATSGNGLATTITWFAKWVKFDGT